MVSTKLEKEKHKKTDVSTAEVRRSARQAERYCGANPMGRGGTGKKFSAHTESQRFQDAEKYGKSMAKKELKVNTLGTNKSNLRVLEETETHHMTRPTKKDKVLQAQIDALVSPGTYATGASGSGIGASGSRRAKSKVVDKKVSTYEEIQLAEDKGKKEGLKSEEHTLRGSKVHYLRDGDVKIPPMTAAKRRKALDDLIV